MSENERAYIRLKITTKRYRQDRQTGIGARRQRTPAHRATTGTARLQGMLVHGVETVVVVGAPSRAGGSFGACLRPLPS